MPRWFYSLFFLSGASALIYELIWQRLLNLVFGVSTLAVSAELAAFMGGLALGGLIFGRRADQSPRPLRLYAWLEVGIAVSALLVPAGFSLMTAAYTGLYTWLQPGLWGGTFLRFFMAMTVLLVPATLIGGTMPVMGRLIARGGQSSPTAFSILYGVNTLGAVLGAALTGFVFLRHLGMTETLLIAVGLNLMVAVGAGHASLKSWGKEVSTDPASPGAAFSLSAPAVSLPRAGLMGSSALACAALTGAAALGLEVAWTRVLGIFTSNSAYAFTLVLSVMLLGLGVGSVLQAVWSRRSGDSWCRLAICQWLLGAFTIASLPFFRVSPAWLERWSDGASVAALFLGELALTASALFVPAVLMGMSFPLLAAPRFGEQRPFGRWLGRVYAVNTLGGVAGAFFAGFILVPGLGIQATLEVFGIGSLVVGTAAWCLRARSGRLTRSLICAGVAAAAGLAIVLLPRGGYYKSRVEAPRQLLYYREGNNGTVEVVREWDGVRSIMVDGQPVAGTAGTSVIDQKMLAHLPLLIHPGPRRALTVGFGSGGTSYSMTLHGIDVDCVEIERAVPAAAGLFHSENCGVLGHPHFHLIVDDARSWLRVAPTHYDVIVTDCTNVQYKSNGDLYTVDYFRLMKQRLTEDGVAAAWVPANGIDPADLKTLLRSFQNVFPHTSVWFMNTLPTDFLIVVGTPQALDIDLKRWEERMSVPAVRQDLASIGLDHPCRLLYTFLTAGTQLANYLGKGDLNTDDRPVLSYLTYGASFRSTIATNLIELLACRDDVEKHVRHGEHTEIMLRHHAASIEAVLGHICFQRGEGREALRHYVNGYTVLGDDPALRHLVAVTYLGARQRDQ